MQKATKITIAAVCGLVPAFLYSYSTGPDPRNTGAPGDSTCARSGCHSGTALNGGGGDVQLTSSAGANYTPGQQQTLTITITDSKAKVYGFQATARPDSDSTNGQAGDFTAGAQQQVLCDNGRNKGANGCAASAPVQFIEHSRPFGTNVMNVTWTAPSSDVGPVTIYVAANAANGNGNETGDHIYTTKLQLTPATPVTSNNPLINDGGVNSLSGYAPKAGAAPGTWLEIAGKNLATTSRTWQPSDFNGNNAPTSLDGVSVTIGGQNAYIKSVDPAKVVVQVPDGIPIGDGVPLVLTDAQGQTSPYVLHTSDLAPALMAPANLKTSNAQYVSAMLASSDPSNPVYAAPAGIADGVNTQPALPGDIVVLSGIGFGPVSPDTPAGVLATDQTTLDNPVTILFGNTPAVVQYAGLALNDVGMYQFIVQVPNVDSGDWPITIQLGGLTVTPNVYITTGQASTDTAPPPDGSGNGDPTTPNARGATPASRAKTAK
jgi:uncharacterized protein (TIGR03437 family)